MGSPLDDLATPSDGQLSGFSYPLTTFSTSGDIFAFRPPTRPNNTAGSHRFQTASSITTEPIVVTPPTGVPLSELASFNGFVVDSQVVAPNTSSSGRVFAYRPPTTQTRGATTPRSPLRASSHSPELPSGNTTQPAGPFDDISGSSTRRIDSRRESIATNVAEAVAGAPAPKVQGKTDSPSKIPFEETFTGRSGQSRTDNPLRSNVGSDRDQRLESSVDCESLPPLQDYTIESEAYLDDPEDSPYAEVRAAVSNTDDIEMPCLTFRVWIIGFVMLVSTAIINSFFSFRATPWSSGPMVILLVVHPFGLALAWLLPIRSWSLPQNLPVVGGWEFSLNPSPWNIKEHTLIMIMCYPANNPMYSLGVISTVEKRYDIPLPMKFTVLIGLSTYLIGIGLGGLSRNLLVRPASLIWPLLLVWCTVLNTLHAGNYPDPRGGISRSRVLGYVTTIAAFYALLPGFFFTSLSYFSFVCWAWPSNAVLNQLFGTVTGLGMSMVTFDWSQIAWIGPPLAIPFWTQVNIVVGFGLSYWVTAPTLYYLNVWKTGHLPISVSGAYDRFGQPYNVSRIVKPDNTFNSAEYDLYSPIYLSVTLVVTYILAFMFTAAVLVHAALHFGPRALRWLRKIPPDHKELDIHAQLMGRYPSISSWYYWVCYVCGIIFAVTAVKTANVGVAAWVPLVAIILCAIDVLPFGYMAAVTGQTGSNNIAAQLLTGVLLPGSAIGNMIVKMISVQGVLIALGTTYNLKLAHYMKCPDKPVFYVQIFGAIVGVVTQSLVKELLFRSVPDICSPNQSSDLTCPEIPLLYTSSVMWGLIGPMRQFGKSSVYWGLPYAFVAGAILPVLVWLWVRRSPNSRFRYVDIPILLNGPTWLPELTGTNYASWFIVGFIFQYWIRRRKPYWWFKYNYILSAALDTGTSIGTAVIFFALQLPKSGQIGLDWWGNIAWTKTADFEGVPYYSTDPTKGF